MRQEPPRRYLAGIAIGHGTDGTRRDEPRC